jgi:hypothetical protein
MLFVGSMSRCDLDFFECVAHGTMTPHPSQWLTSRHIDDSGEYRAPLFDLVMLERSPFTLVGQAPLQNGTFAK